MPIWSRGLTLAVVQQTLLLALDLGEPKAAAVLRQVARDEKTPKAMRLSALSALVERRLAGLVPDLHALLDDAAVRGPVLRALAAYDDPATPEILLSRYGSLPESDRNDAIATLASRPRWALLLLDAVENGRVRRRDLSIAIARQLQAFGDSEDQFAARIRLGQDPADFEVESPLGGEVQVTPWF